MTTPTFSKEINGHQMTIHFHTGQGGGLEEAVLWCRTCDPEGENVVTRETTESGVRDAVVGLMESAENHAEDPPTA